jgi:hypothetical protein
MNAELKAKWVEALRSGKFHQGKGFLKFDEEQGPRHCCLGVLCEIIDPSKFALREYSYYYQCDGMESDITLPLSLQFQTDLSGETCTLLAEKNDHGKSFNNIADYIEHHL